MPQKQFFFSVAKTSLLRVVTDPIVFYIVKAKKIQVAYEAISPPEIVG